MATYYNNLQPQEKLNLIGEILSIYRYFPKNLFFDLVSATNEVSGVSFVNIKGYCSDASNNSEIADQIVNIGASYQNMINKDADKYANCDYNKFCTLVDDFNLQYINTNGKSEIEFKNEVKANFQTVLTDLLTPKPQSEKVDNFIHFNKVLAYNRNTKNLSIFGMQVTKNVIVKAETERVSIGEGDFAFYREELFIIVRNDGRYKTEDKYVGVYTHNGSISWIKLKDAEFFAKHGFGSNLKTYVPCQCNVVGIA